MFRLIFSMIRDAERKDIAAIQALLNSHEALRATPDAAYDERHVAGLLESPVNRVYVCDQDGAVVGVLVAEFWTEKGYCFLDFLVVDAAHRGRGIGSRLYRHLEGRCAAAGIGSIASLVKTENRFMRDWSRRLGFTEGSELRYYEKRIGGR